MQPAPESSAVWTATIAVRSYDVDATRYATVQSLCRYFLEAAWSHAEALGVGFSHLASQERVWVLSRLLMQIQRLPAWGETFSLRTWPRGTQSLFALRDFELRDKSDAVLIAGGSSWLVLNARSRRPQRLPPLLSSVRNLPQERAVARDPEKLSATAGLADRIHLTTRPSDMDVNAHVNSARYLEWILDSYPMEFTVGHRLADLEVNYLGETRVNESVTVRSGQCAPGEWCHDIIRSGAEQVCRARLHWQTSGKGNPG